MSEYPSKEQILGVSDLAKPPEKLTERPVAKENKSNILQPLTNEEKSVAKAFFGSQYDLFFAVREGSLAEWKKARDILSEKYRGFVISKLIPKFNNPSAADMGEIEGAADEFLLIAIDKFDMSMCNNFSVYLENFVVPLAMNKAHDELSRKGGMRTRRSADIKVYGKLMEGDPTLSDKEIMDTMGIREKKLRTIRAMHALTVQKNFESLDTLSRNGGAQAARLEALESEISRSQHDEERHPPFDLDRMRAEIKALLTEKEYKILTLRLPWLQKDSIQRKGESIEGFGRFAEAHDALGIKEVGKKFGVSHQRISQIEAVAKQKIRIHAQSSPVFRALLETFDMPMQKAGISGDKKKK